MIDNERKKYLPPALVQLAPPLNLIAGLSTLYDERDISDNDDEWIKHEDNDEEP